MPQPKLPRIRGTQIGLHSPGQIDQIKDDMLAGRFAFEEQRAQVAGVRDRNRTYYVKVGHHRVVAAMEIYRQKRDASFILELIRLGKWDNVDHPPNDSRPLPARNWWGSLRNKLNV